MKLVGGKKEPVQKLIEEAGTNIPGGKPRKKKETLTDTEQILMGKIFDAYEAQYKKKSPLNYAMAQAIRKKLIRMKIVEERS